MDDAAATAGPAHTPAMKGQVRAFWLNALIITVTITLWLTILGGLAAGVLIGWEAASESSCSFDDELGYYTDDGRPCVPSG
jgi:hypothetical protein